ncbi:hypothetical protein JCM8208_006055 [Rhodotorula glutinis]
MTGLHRRGSSAALYVPVTTESAEMTESFSSANRLARPRTSSISPESTRPHKGDLDDEPQEKDAFIPTTRYERPGAAGALGWRDASGRGTKGGRGCGWKGKLVVLLLVGGTVGAAVWFAFFRPDARDGDDAWLEAYKPGWWRSSLSSAVAEAEATASAVGLKANVQWDSATGALGDSFGTATSRWTEATQAAAASYKGAYNDDYEGYTDDEYSTEQGDDSSASSYKDAAVAGAFSVAASELVSTLLDNGTLAAYNWHETLPSLGSAHSLDGRLLVVGDLHGTHRSLVSLLKRLSFSPSSDTLLHVGDVVAKSALNDSLTTVSLLRKLGAKGVRGNHDQRVIEWRKWMEAYGPLDATASAPTSLHPSAAVKKVGSAIKNMQQLAAGKKQQVQSGFSRVAQSASSVQDRAASKLKAAHGHHDPAAAYKKERAPMMPRERKVKRSFMTWLAGDGTEDDDDNEPALSVFEEPQDEVDAKDESAATVDDTDVYSFDLLVSAGAPSASKSSVVVRASSSSAASSSSSSTHGGRQPFGRPTTLASASSVASSSLSSSSRVRARPSSSTSSRASSSTSTSSVRATSIGVPASAARLASTIAYSATYDSSGALVGASYAHLDPSLTPAERSSLGLVVPEGWEWGGEHFELARHLSSADVAYLEQLPLTLYVDEIKSYVVHAGMVPWSSLDRTLSRVESVSTSSKTKGKSRKTVPASLDSTSPLSFSPSTSLARLLAQHSSRTALLLDKLNTSPFTLLNMRTLTHSGGAAHNAQRVKGPPGKGEWAVSAKGRKAGKGAMPWWGVWEDGMKECGDTEACEEVGVVYGHWAGQGLQVQEHSIGLDTGCVYGRRLSALVVPLSSTSSSTSGPLSPATSASSVASSLKSSAEGAASSLAATVKNVTSSSSSGSSKKKVAAAAAKKAKSSASSLLADAAAAASTNTSASALLESATARAAKPKSHPKWTGGGMQRVKGSAPASASTSATTTATESSASAGAEAVVRVSRLVDSASFEDLDLARPSSSSSSAGSTAADDDEEALIIDADSSSDPSAADKPWWRPWKRAPPQGRPGVAPWGDEDAEERSAPPSLYGDDDDEEEEQDEQDVDAEGASSASRAQAKKAKGRAQKAQAHAHALAQQEADALVEDDAAEAQDVAVLVEEDEDDDEWVVGESAFREERVVLAAAAGKVAWVVSVDCAAEADIE